MKRVIAEMGGKNAIVVDADADLDEAVPAIVAQRVRVRGPEVLGRVAGDRARSPSSTSSSSGWPARPRSCRSGRRRELAHGVRAAHRRRRLRRVQRYRVARARRGRGRRRAQRRPRRRVVRRADGRRRRRPARADRDRRDLRPGAHGAARRRLRPRARARQRHRLRAHRRPVLALAVADRRRDRGSCGPGTST